MFQGTEAKEPQLPPQALGETVVAVQWGPWREVGMAATKGTAPWNFLRDEVKIESDRILQMMYVYI